MVHVPSPAGGFPQHVHKLDDPVTGLSGLIVIHSTPGWVRRPAAVGSVPMRTRPRSRPTRSGSPKA